MFRSCIVCTVFFATATWVAAQPAQPKLPENVEKAQALLGDHLKQIKGDSGQILWLNDKALAAAFPKHIFFAVRYRVYPVAKKMPEDMKPSNVFVVEGGKLQHLADVKALTAFFTSQLAKVAKGDAATNAARAWLTLSQEFVQDGFYMFEIPAKEIIVTAKSDDKSVEPLVLSVEGRAIVMKGGNGAITLNIRFDKEGKVAGVADKATVKRGPRPICQATKLLDADPLVRKMAEEDLLYMGLAARDYLMEQRALASPALQRAIDRLWLEIVEKGW